MTVTSVVVDERFHGPPRSGHGGYSAGLVARAVGNPAEVTLRRPPPLGRPLDLERRDDGTVVLRDGDDTVAEGRSCERLDVEPPPPVHWADAVQARATAEVTTAEDHSFPTCFGCGPRRDDGLRLLAGPVVGREDVYAAPWVPEPSFADDSGHVGQEFVWAALDCPTGWATIHATETPRVLGRLAVDQRGPVELGYRYVVTAWWRATEGRKAFSEGALSTDMGNVQAVARATWIEVDPSDFSTQEM